MFWNSMDVRLMLELGEDCYQN